MVLQAKYYLNLWRMKAMITSKLPKYFDEVSGEEKYKEKPSYYQADMNFKLDFPKAIRFRSESNG
jgi:hypothetical protein